MDISEFKRLHTTSNYSRHPWEIARGRVLLHFLRKDIPLPQPKLVDIGSGDAYIINLLFSNNVSDTYAAIDIAYTPEIVRQLTENNSGSPIGYFANIQEIYKNSFPGGSTLYLCMDVLEHLQNESEVLNLIIKEGAARAPAYYFFSVPAFQSVFSNHDVLLGHYRRYSRRQFEDLFITRGLTVIDSGYFFFSLLIARWFEKKMLRKKDYSIDNWEGSPAKTRFLAFILGIDFAISRTMRNLGIRLPGLSCYCICQA